MEQRATTAVETPVRRIEFDVDWPPGHVAAYLLETDEPVLVDAGQPGGSATGELEAGLAEHGYEIADVEHLVLTHAHPDHTGQTPTVLERADPTVYAPALVTDRLGRDVAAFSEAVRANTTGAGTAEADLDTAVEWARASIEYAREHLPEEAVDVWIEADEPFAAGGVTFDPVHTPGHNAEHHVYLATLDGERVAFSGDMAIRTFRAVLMHTGLDDGVRDSVPAFETALDRLAAHDVDRVYPGHGAVHEEYEAALDQSRESLDRLLDRTHEYLAEGEHDTAVGIAADRMDGDADSRSLGYMLPETVGALAHLARTGRATSEIDERGVRQYTAE
jgi:glyoxylase-like metal-dependent hydrolase (beta-lactamase superfamily II)